MNGERILVLNPGSTSTKVAVFEGETPLFTESAAHTREELQGFDRVADQLDFRRGVVQRCLREHGIPLHSLDAVVSRGGMLAPLQAGAYEINEDMVWQLRFRPSQEHAASVGALIAYAISKEYGIPAYIYDGITVDELTPVNRVTGLPSMHRKGIGHNLNTRAAAIRYAQEAHRAYEDITAIVAHMGGGITMNLHHRGRIEDFISDDEGPFSPERAGGLPLFDVIKLCFEPGQSCENVMRLVKTGGGLTAHLGTTDCGEVERRAREGDENARLVYEAMALSVAKNIAKCAAGVCGAVDVIILTGGIAKSNYITEYIRAHVSFIAPVVVYPGEDEMGSLVRGCLRVLRGQERARTYFKVPEL